MLLCFKTLAAAIAIQITTGNCFSVPSIKVYLSYESCWINANTSQSLWLFSFLQHT